MKKFAIMLGAVAMLFVCSEAFADHGYRGYNRGRSSFSISIGNGFNGFSYGRGVGGFGYGYGGFGGPIYGAPVVPVAPVYRVPVYRGYGYGPVYGGGINFNYGRGFGGYGRGCGW